MCRVCSKCKSIFYEGHCFGDGELYLCPECADDLFTEEQLNIMYDEESQYCSMWTEDDFDSKEEMNSYIESELSEDYSETIENWVIYAQTLGDKSLNQCECCWGELKGITYEVDGVTMCEDCFKYIEEGDNA